MEQKKDWVKDLIVYQVYPRSFQDSNGDGIGDIPGILSRLDHLSALGINALWLSPVFRSPNDDNGYDISGYREIMDEFGTMEDWDALCAECHKRGIKVIMDLVVNHSSDEHPWFLESKTSRDNSKSDYYIWRDPKNGKEPNNWASVFGGSAWEFVPERGQYYYHLFSKKQPDLNWANPALREEIFSMMEWWVKKGVDGFRVDAISYLDKPQDFPDSAEPPQPDGYSFSSSLINGRPGTHAYIRDMNRRVFSPYNVMTVGEVASKDAEELARYVNTDREEFDMAIPFVAPIVEINTWSPKKMKQDIQNDYDALKENGWWARFFSNHDKPRQVSLYGNDKEYWEVSAKMLAMLLHSLPGTPFVYQGEEIGMTNPHFSRITDYRDVESLNMFAELRNDGRDADELLAILASKSRDNSRTPMQWSNGDNAGFTAGEPWIGLGDNYQQINVEAALADDSSVFYTYQKLIALRKQEAILTWGNYQDLLPNSPVLWCYRREWKGQTLLVIANLSREIQPWQPGQMRGNWQLVMHNYEEASPQPCAMTLRPFEAVWWLQK